MDPRAGLSTLVKRKGSDLRENRVLVIRSSSHSGFHNGWQLVEQLNDMKGSKDDMKFNALGRNQSAVSGNCNRFHRDLSTPPVWLHDCR